MKTHARLLIHSLCALTIAVPPAWGEQSANFNISGPADISTSRALVPVKGGLPVDPNAKPADGGAAPKEGVYARARRAAKAARERHYDRMDAVRGNIRAARTRVADKIYDERKDFKHKQSVDPNYDRLKDPNVRLPDARAVVSTSSPPSDFERKMNWTADDTLTMRRRIHQGISGERPFLDVRPVVIHAREELPSNAFFIGLIFGAGAAYNLISNYSHNPIAISRYMESMTDGIGWLSITGFVLTLAPFLKWMDQDKIRAGGFAKQWPIFMTGMALASMVQSGISRIGNDKDVRACMGFDEFGQLRKSFFAEPNPAKIGRDMDACDRAAAKVESGELSTDVFLQSLPSVAAGAIAGTAFFRFMIFLRKMPVERALKIVGMAGSASPWGLAIRGGYTIATVAVMMTMSGATESIFHPATHFLNEKLISSWNKRGPIYGRSVDDATNDLMMVWERSRKSGWRDTSDFSSLKTVCLDLRRGDPAYDCDKPRELDFAGTLEAHAEWQKNWRDEQLKEPLRAWKEWTEKAGEYRESYAQSKQFYQGAIAKLAYTRANPNAAPDDKMVFNQANLEIVNDNTMPAALRAFIARTHFFESQDGTFGRVSTPTKLEAWVAGMACGPDATSSVKANWMEGVRQFAGRWMTMNYAPQKVVDNSFGKRAVFNPPRITRPLDNTSESACEQRYDLSLTNLIGLPLFVYQGVASSLVSPSIDQVPLDVDGKHYVGLFDYIKDNVRDDILNADGPNFDGWWATYVEPRNQGFEAKMRKQYQEILTSSFQPAIVRDDYAWCETSPVTRTPLGQYVTRLGGAGGGCSADRSHRLAYGVLNSLRDQIRLYVAMMVDLYVANQQTLGARTVDKKTGQIEYPQATALAENRIFMKAKRLLDAYDEMANGVAASASAEAHAAAMASLKAKLDEFADVALNRGEGALTYGDKDFLPILGEQVLKLRHEGRVVTMNERLAQSLQWMKLLDDQLRLAISEWAGYHKVAVIKN